MDHQKPVEDMTWSEMVAEARQLTQRVPPGYSTWMYGKVVEYKEAAKRVGKYLKNPNNVQMHLMRPALKLLRTFW